MKPAPELPFLAAPDGHALSTLVDYACGGLRALGQRDLANAIELSHRACDFRRLPGELAEAARVASAIEVAAIAMLGAKHSRQWERLAANTRRHLQAAELKIQRAA